MIMARIRLCTCRVENILTLGKLLSLWFCFLLHSILFLISQTSYRTYQIISSYELAPPVMGTIFLVIYDLLHGSGCNMTHISRETRLNTPVWSSLRSPNYPARLRARVNMMFCACECLCMTHPLESGEVSA